MRRLLWSGMMALMLFATTAGKADIPRPEHPRPDFMRPHWQNLNGQWEFAYDPKDEGLMENWFDRDSLPERITVPYPIESELSGLGNTAPGKVVWYLKKFDADPCLEPMGGHIILNFGAVDYQATVWLNGKKLGEHVGGYTPFSFDVTGIIRPQGNRLAVRVFDSLDKMQARGKQTDTGKPYLIMYTDVTGIWQTVWLERTGDPYVKSYRFIPAKDLSGGNFRVELSEDRPGLHTEIEIAPMGAAENCERVPVKDGAALWFCKGPKTWSPDSPNLYRITIFIRDQGDFVRDQVESYVGIRTIGTSGQKVLLNGKDFYQKLLLDQGYFPGGIYTPRDDAIMKADVEMYKRMGFNGLRKHQKIEDPRFLYWCDVLGLVVWEEMPSLGFGVPRKVPEVAKERFRDEWLAAIARDVNHPCIITWTVYNENWGITDMQYRKSARQWARATVQATKSADPTRLVVDNSGGWHFATDVWDFHHYLSTDEKARKLYDQYNLSPGDHYGMFWYAARALTGGAVIPSFIRGTDYEGQPIILSEYGGFGFYKTKGDQGLLDLYRDYTLAIGDYPYMAGYCYTQPYDVEQEQNGLMTFDREPKVPVEEIKKINDAVGW